MDILIKNFGGVARAAFNTDGNIVFIAGLNAAGKTSILKPVSLVLARQPCAIEGVQALDRFKRSFIKRDYPAYVKEGEQGGFAQISEGEKTAKVVWPAGEVSAMGEAPYANIIASGLAKFGEISADARKIILIDVLKADPTFEEVTDELKDARWSEKNIDGLWQVIQRDGWDGAHDRTKTQVTEAKGAWQQITGEQRWGPRKAVFWVPDGWEANLSNMDREQLKRDAAAVSQDRDKAQRKIGILERAIEQDDTAIKNMDGMKRTLTKAETEKVELIAKVAELEDDLAKMPNPSGDSGSACPSCGANLKVVTDGGFLSFQIYKEPGSKEAFDKQVKARAEKKKEVVEARHRYSAVTDQIIGMTRSIKTAEEAAKTINGKRAELETLRKKGAELLDTAVILTQRARAVDLVKMAKEKNLEITVGEKTAEVLNPGGLRRQVLMKRMDAFNKRLANISAIAKWGTVKVDGNFVLRLDGRHYVVLSGAQRLAADITVQIAIAMVTKAAMMVIDTADTFVGPNRNKLFTVLNKVKVPVIVGMSMPNPAKVPNLAAMDMGHTYWVDKGVLRPIDEVLEK